MMEVGNRLGVLCSQQTREEAVRKMGLGGRLPEQSLNGTPSFSCHPGTMSPSGRDSRGLWAGTACALNAAHSASYSVWEVSCHQQVPSCLWEQGLGSILPFASLTKGVGALSKQEKKGASFQVGRGGGYLTWRPAARQQPSVGAETGEAERGEEPLTSSGLAHARSATFTGGPERRQSLWWVYMVSVPTVWDRAYKKGKRGDFPGSSV